MSSLMAPMVSAFFDFIEERYSIWYKKTLLKEDPPWTTDSILSEYRFTNVMREYDRVTIWVDKNIRKPYADHPNLWFMLCIARQLNWPDTLKELMLNEAWPDDAGILRKRELDWDADLAGNILDARKARGDKVYTGAYMIRAESDKNKSWYNWTKQQYMTKIVLGKVWENRESIEQVLSENSIKSATDKFATYHGWGPFMSYQVVVDLSWTRYLKNAKDLNTYSALGPGSRRGLNRLAGRNVLCGLSQDDGLEEMVELFNEQWLYLKKCPSLRLSDIQNCLCEFDKYLRVKNGEGRPRAKYVHNRGY